MCHAQIPHSETTPTYVCNSEKVARHGEQTRTEIAAGTYRHREQQQQQQQEQEQQQRRPEGATPRSQWYTRTTNVAYTRYQVACRG